MLGRIGSYFRNVYYIGLGCHSVFLARLYKIWPSNPRGLSFQPRGLAVELHLDSVAALPVQGDTYYLDFGRFGGFKILV